MESVGTGAATNNREALDSRFGEEVAAATADVAPMETAAVATAAAEAAMSAAAAAGALRLEAEGATEAAATGAGAEAALGETERAYDVFFCFLFFI
jgi:hypothetical protein